MHIPFASDVHLRTLMPKEEVVRRLRENVASPYSFLLFPWFGSSVVGRVGQNSCTLRYRTWYNNSFQRRLRLDIKNGEVGTSLIGEFSAHPAALLFMGVWFSGVILFCLGSIVVLLTDSSQHTLSPILLPFVMLAFGGVLVRFCLWLSRSSESSLLDFLKETIGAVSSTSKDLNVVLPQWPQDKPVPGGVLIRPHHEVPGDFKPR